jgi:hypothetical protein
VGTSSGLAVFGLAEARDLAGKATNMTCSGMYDCHAQHMLNIEFARIVQADREREIEAELRTRRLLRPSDTVDTGRADSRKSRASQRPASSGVASR